MPVYHTVYQRVIQVSACERHLLFLCEDGSVYASGDGYNGRLGDGITDSHLEGTPIQINRANIYGKRVIQVSTVMRNSLFLCENSSVYASSYGYDGTLGDGRKYRHDEGTLIPIDAANMQGKRETGLTCQSVSL